MTGKLPRHTADNIGAVDQLVVQNNGTNRIKGSQPELVLEAGQINRFLHAVIPPLVARTDLPISRLSSRHFCTLSAVSGLIQEVDQQMLENFKLQIEAVVPLGAPFFQNGFQEPIYWVWIGGNTPERGKYTTVTNGLISKWVNPALYNKQLPTPKLLENYNIHWVGSKSRLQQDALTSHLSTFVQKRVIDQKLADQLADLYKARFPTYVTPVHDPKHFIDSVANDENTVLFVTTDSRGRVVAAVSNEFATYPVLLPNNEVGYVKVCESNDWVRRGAAKEHCNPTQERTMAFRTTLAASLMQAVSAEPAVIEAECVPHAIPTAARFGFLPTARPLLHTSHMITDTPNPELTDPEVSEEFRKYNSLFLMCITPNSYAWQHYTSQIATR